MRVASSGRAPSPPFLLVANHLSYVDVVLLMSRVEAVFVARADVAGWPVLGRLARAAGTIFVARERARDLPRAAARIERALRGGAGVVLFPEGTSTEGAEVLPFRPSLLSAAVSAGAPVAWAALTYATPRGTPSARRAVCWWGEMRFAGHFLRLLALPRFDARVVFGAGPVAGGDRKEIAARARRAVAATFVPVPIEA
jgi:1-acyl-sn-glycerol-3-phosphate acyltransferase